MKKRYSRNEGCYATVIKVLEKGQGMILELDNGEEAYCSGYRTGLMEESVVLCAVRKSAYKGRRMLVEIVDVVEYATSGSSVNRYKESGKCMVAA